jgi:hypothetical protein
MNVGPHADDAVALESPLSPISSIPEVDTKKPIARV